MAVGTLGHLSCGTMSVCLRPWLGCTLWPLPCFLPKGFWTFWAKSLTAFSPNGTVGAYRYLLEGERRAWVIDPEGLLSGPRPQA